MTARRAFSWNVLHADLYPQLLLIIDHTGMLYPRSKFGEIFKEKIPTVLKKACFCSKGYVLSKGKGSGMFKERVIAVAKGMLYCKFCVTRSMLAPRPCKETLHGGEGVLDYGNLIWVTLQRSKTAREAILTFDQLVKEQSWIRNGFKVEMPSVKLNIAPETR